MKRRSIPSRLVNFRVPNMIIDPFDEKCFLEGKTRTSVLCSLIEGRVKCTELYDNSRCPQVKSAPD